VDPEFFETLNRPIVSGRSFHGNDCGPNSRTVIVNEAFARAFSRHTGGGSPVGARLRYADSAAVSTETAPQSWFEIVGVVRDIGLDPDDWGNEKPFVFHAGTAGTPSTLVMSVRVRGDPAPLAARLPFIAADVDARLLIRESRPLADWIRDRDMGLIVAAGAQAAVTALVLFLSALSIFSLISISVSRRKREIGIRTALGASARDVLSRVLFRSLALIGLGTSAGGVLLLVFVAKVRPAEELALYAAWLGMTVTIIFAASLPACVGPARRALRISPADLLREV
jgi:hypothetical protein